MSTPSMTPKTPYTRTNRTKVITTQVELNVRHAVLGQHEALDDPGLTAVLGQQPARRVHKERGDDGPGGEEQEPAGRSSRWRHTAHAPHSASRNTSAAR